MESLLSLAFDNTASRNTSKIRKGLRQIEGLLAQICLSPSSSSTAVATTTSEHSPSKHRRQTSVVCQDAQYLSTPPPPPPPPAQLQVLAEDLAFQEFFRLQDSFEWNVATRLTECLERLLGMHPSPQIDDLIHATLTLLQGALLLHPPSRALFSRENHMTLVLDLLDPKYGSGQTLCAALLVLTTALLERPTTARLFERLDGVNTVASLLREQQQQQNQHDETAAPKVGSLCREFLAVYLMPEAPTTAPLSFTNSSAPTTPHMRTDMPPPTLPASSTPSRPPSHHRAPSKSSSTVSSSTVKSDGSASSTGTGGTGFSSASSGVSIGFAGGATTRTTLEKQKLLSECLGGGGEADGLLRDLKHVWVL